MTNIALINHVDHLLRNMPDEGLAKHWNHYVDFKGKNEDEKVHRLLWDDIQKYCSISKMNGFDAVKYVAENYNDFDLNNDWFTHAVGIKESCPVSADYVRDLINTYELAGFLVETNADWGKIFDFGLLSEYDKFFLGGGTNTLSVEYLKNKHDLGTAIGFVKAVADVLEQIGDDDRASVVHDLGGCMTERTLMVNAAYSILNDVVMANYTEPLGEIRNYLRDVLDETTWN